MNWHNRGARPLGNSRKTTDRFSLTIALWIAAISSASIMNGAAAAGSGGVEVGGSCKRSDDWKIEEARPMRGAHR